MVDQIFRAWNPLGDIPRTLWLESVRDDVEGMRLLLRGKDHPSPTLRLLFDTVVAYRNVNESFLLRTWASMPDQQSMPTLMEIENSRFVTWIVEQSAGVLNAESLTHYAVYTPEDCVDVIAEHPPIAEWLNG